MTGPARPTIGLNLLYLAPGETGGMEVYARSLIPAEQCSVQRCEMCGT